MSAGNAKHQAARRTTADLVDQLRGEIHDQLRRLRKVAGDLGDLADTHQPVSLAADSEQKRAARDNQARADRAAARAPGAILTGVSLAPVTVPAVSAAAEIRFGLLEHVRRLSRAAKLVALEAEQTENEDHDVCTWPRRPIARLHLLVNASGTADVSYLATRLDVLVDAYTNRPGLQRILRDLEHLEDLALTVTTGEPAERPAPNPLCPWCGRDTVVWITRENGVIYKPENAIFRCKGTHACCCNRELCPCAPPRGERHQWQRGAADSVQQLANLQTKHQELARMETKAVDALERIRTLHHLIELYPPVSDCTNPAHAEHHVEAYQSNDEICTACPPAAEVCGTCVEHNADYGPSALAWPCPTYEATQLDESTTNDPSSTRSGATL